mgnify:CR=1 FL=1
MKTKIVPDAWFIIMLALSCTFHYLIPVARIIPHPYNLTGIVFILSGFALTLAANFVMIKSHTTNQPGETPDMLLTTGPFKISRNPVYLGMTIILMGVEILLGSLSALIVPVIFVIIIDRLFIKPEEDVLESLFGERYSEYSKRVRRWL